jgi:hypothetical protein
VLRLPRLPGSILGLALTLIALAGCWGGAIVEVPVRLPRPVRPELPVVRIAAATLDTQAGAPGLIAVPLADLDAEVLGELEQGRVQVYIVEAAAFEQALLLRRAYEQQLEAGLWVEDVEEVEEEVSQP